MNRNVKNLIMIIIIIIAVICSFCTMKNSNILKVSSNTNGNGNDFQLGEPPAKPDGENGSNQGESPTKPDGENNSDQGEPPAKPDEENNSDQGEPPAKPDGENGSNQGEPPAKPDGENSSNQEEPPAKPDEENNLNQEQKSKTYILFLIEACVISILLVYLIMSKLNEKTFKMVMENSNKIIYIIAVIIVTIILMFLQLYLTKTLFSNNSIDYNNSIDKSSNSNMTNSNIVYNASYEVTSDENLQGTYTAEDNDQSAIIVSDGGNLTLSDSNIEKSSGDSSNTENSEFYGVNSGILVKENSTATISNSNITTNAKGANAVFSTGENSKIYISDSTITTTGESSSRGLDATYSGYIEAENVNITTQGGSCATLATDRGEGTVIANNSKFETNGTGSPIIYSTGDISIDNSEGTANGSQMVVIEGKNSATVKNSKLNATGKGNRGDVDQAGIMIYQSMSGDASVGTGEFTSENSDLSILETSEYYKTAPMFFITNTDAVINLTNTKLSYGSNVLVKCEGTTEWGNEGKNGGNLVLNANNQQLIGDILVDEISNLEMKLVSSTYEGTINSNNTAEGVSITLDKDSKIVLTGDSYITSIDDEDETYSNIDFNGYKLYVNGSAIN